MRQGEREDPTALLELASDDLLRVKVLGRWQRFQRVFPPESPLDYQAHPCAGVDQRRGGIQVKATPEAGGRLVGLNPEGEGELVRSVGAWSGGSSGGRGSRQAFAVGAGKNGLRMERDRSLAGRLQLLGADDKAGPKMLQTGIPTGRDIGEGSALRSGRAGAGSRAVQRHRGNWVASTASQKNDRQDQGQRPAD